MILINKKLAKCNPAVKATLKISKKKLYGKAIKPVLKSKTTKFVMCTTAVNTSLDSKYCSIDRRLTASELLSLVTDAKLPGMSGSGFPVATKLNTFINSRASAKRLLINGVECDPLLVHDQWLISSCFHDICKGIEIIANALGVDDIAFAAKSFPDDATLYVSGNRNIRLYKVRPGFPMGEEHILIHQVYNTEMSKQEIPAEKGILVMNVQTVYSILKLISGEEADGRYVTVADLDASTAEPLYIRFGDNVYETLCAKFGDSINFYTGSSVFHAEAVKKTDVFTPSVTFGCIARKTAHNTNANKCKGCGACQRVCPMHIKIKKIVAIREKNPNGDISGLGAERCLHCNSCSYTCAAEKNIFEYLN